MRPNCHCGNIAGYWYGPSLSEQGIVKPSVEVFLKEKAYCGVCADTENWAEYWWIGFHKKDWQWLKIRDLKILEAQHIEHKYNWIHAIGSIE